MESLAGLNAGIAGFSAFGGLVGAVIGWFISFRLEVFKFKFKKRELLFAIRLEALHALNILNKSLFDVGADVFYGLADDSKYWEYLSTVSARHLAIERELKAFLQRYEAILSKEVGDEIADGLLCVSMLPDFGMDGVDTADKADQAEGCIATVKTHLNKAYTSLYGDLIV